MKRLKIFGNIFSTILLIMLVVTVAGLGVPKLFGIENRAIISGSMTPNYNIGDMVYAVPTEFEKIQDGDVISYVINENQTVVTHRVVELDVENRQFYTQGDANNTRDGSPVKYENVLGVVKFSVPYVGKVIMLLDNQTYKILAITGIAVLVLLSVIIKINTKNDKKSDIIINPAADEVLDMPDSVVRKTVIEAKESEVGAAGELEQRLKAWEEQLRQREKELNFREQEFRNPQLRGARYDLNKKKGIGGHMKAFFTPDDALFPRLALLLVVLLLAAGVTFSLLKQLTDEKVNNFNIGKVKVDIDEPDVNNENAEWGAEKKPVILHNTGSVNAVIRAIIVPVLKESKENGKYLGGNLDILQAPTGKILVMGDFTLHFAEEFTNGVSENWVFNQRDGYFYYKLAVPPQGKTVQLLSGVTLNEGVDAEKYKDVTIEIQVYADSLQAGGNALGEWKATVESDGSVSYTF